MGGSAVKHNRQYSTYYTRPVHTLKPHISIQKKNGACSRVRKVRWCLLLLVPSKRQHRLLNFTLTSMSKVNEAEITLQDSGSAPLPPPYGPFQAVAHNRQRSTYKSKRRLSPSNTSTHRLAPLSDVFVTHYMRSLLQPQVLNLAVTSRRRTRRKKEFPWKSSTLSRCFSGQVTY